MRTALLSVAPGLLLLPAAAQTPAPQTTIQQSVTVTADRGLAGINDSAASVTTLTSQQLQSVPGLTLDDSLHAVAGFSLFRRTSSWTANPTTEGVSLRGLGSTAASRTLVVSDEVPLNDPFGGWVHWNEVPTLAIDQVSLERGGASDLYGSSAIGGVIDITPATPPFPFWLFSTPNFGGTPAAANAVPALRFSADALGATESTGSGDALLTTSARRLATLAALSVLSTGGYVPTAPALRGSVDIPANVASQAARLELRTRTSTHDDLFLRGNLLNESRSNGTPLQTDAARLWRYMTGYDRTAENTSYNLRLFGAREGYRQAFSSVAANRNSETLTKLQQVPSDELGFVAHASRAFTPQLTTALGLDLRDIRGTDNETSPSTHITTSTSARQRETGGYADAIWQPRSWSLSGSIRVDSFRTFAARQAASNTTTIAPQPELDELFASPRLGLVRNVAHNLALTATAFRAFRGPTLNELYRTSQVGQQLTLANNALLAERATGFETGIELTTHPARLRATYFWTEVNRPISAVLLSQTPTSQTLQRQNLGQVRSRGLMLEAQSAHWHSLDASFGYQLAFATVTAFNSTSPAQSNLTGNWIPEVPREAFTSTLSFTPHLASFHLLSSYTGQAFDDAANTFLLHPYARFDLSADRTLPHNFALYAAAQDLLNRSIESGRTPVLTLAPPRLIEAGIRYTFAR